MATTPQPQTFTTLPILPLSSALNPDTKPAFLNDLRSALLNVGFLYLSETGLPSTLIQDVIAECKQFFEALPEEEKERIEMKNEKSFLGWSRVSAICFACLSTFCETDWLEYGFSIHRLLVSRFCATREDYMLLFESDSEGKGMRC
jgi:isopenicillin N synthase-like dioxygenase